MISPMLIGAGGEERTARAGAYLRDRTAERAACGERNRCVKQLFVQGSALLRRLTVKARTMLRAPMTIHTRADR
jgi:hypothetical protein